MSTSTALGTLLWSESVCPDGETDVPADHYYPSPALIARIETDWEAFTDRLPDDFEPENAWRGISPWPGWDAWDQLAHDWILTRNGHGLIPRHAFSGSKSSGKRSVNASQSVSIRAMSAGDG